MLPDDVSCNVVQLTTQTAVDHRLEYGVTRQCYTVYSKDHQAALTSIYWSEDAAKEPVPQSNQRNTTWPSNYIQSHPIKKFNVKSALLGVFRGFANQQERIYTV